MFKDQHLAPSLVEGAKITAEALLEATRVMHYAAVGVSGYDLAAGIDYLLAARRQQEFPWVALNLVRQGEQRSPFSPFIIKEVGPTKVAILGLTGSPDPAPPGGSNDFQVLPWEEVLAPVVEQVSRQADLVILLSSYPVAINEKIANMHSKIHLIIQSGHAAANLPPRLVNNTLLCQTNEKGKYLGVMNINWKHTKKWSQDYATQLTTAKNRLQNISWQMGNMEKRHSAQLLAENKQYLSLRALRGELEQEIATLTQKLQQGQPTVTCSFSNRFIKLKSTLPEDPAIKQLVKRAKEKVSKLKVVRGSKSDPGVTVEPPRPSLPPDPPHSIQ